MRRRLWLLVLAAAPVLAGCAAAPAARLDNPMTVAAVDAPTLEKVARRVLQELHFEVEHPPAAEGRLDTAPLTGASWFEFWREDTVGAGQVLESSLHTIRRRVAVAVSPSGQGAAVLVRVDKQRLSAPNTGPDTVARRINIYGEGLDENSELARQDELAPTHYQWLDRGRDDALEQRILHRIRTAVGPDR